MMIGKMYRPLKILNLQGKRGFYILNKYKSNFGGMYQFHLDVYLKYNADEQSEQVCLDFKGLDIPIYMENGFKSSEGEYVSSLETRTIQSLRKLVRPTRISSRDELHFVMLIQSPKYEYENDTLSIALKPIMVNGQEFMRVQVECQTPVVVVSDSSVHLSE